VSCIGAANEITIKPGTSVIQSAVNKATSGDVIILNPGNYFDNVKITKANLTIKSSSGNPDDTWIKSKTSGADVFLLQADSININGLKISGSTATGRSAINLSSCRYCAIENNKLLNNARGIYLLSAHWNAISKNTAASDTEYGIVLGNSTANIISGNAAYNDGRGIHIGNSDSNTLCGNTVRDNSVLGLYVCPKSDRNTIYNNYFNDVNISIKNGTGNLYNTAKTAGTNIVDGPYIGGNYWAKPDGTGFSQKAVDEDEDGISDSAYTSISGSVYSDSLPLVTPGSAPILPIADFKSDVTSGSSPLTVMFTNTSTNTANVSWNFGDGTAAVTGTQVSHTFTNTGTNAQTFTVTLTAINPNGTNTKTGTITVNPAAAVVKPVASFDVSPSSGGTTATTYTFTDTSKKTPTSWFWDFGDKTALDKAKSVTHKYAKTGTYTVKLTANNSAGSATTTKSVTVSAGTPTKSPVASFTYSPATVKKSTTIKFTDTSTNMPKTWKWTFGDGSAAVTSQNPTHVFSKTGSFKVSLAAYNNVGSNTVTKTITVS